MRAWLKVSGFRGRRASGAAIATACLVLPAAVMANTLFTAVPQITSEPVPGNDYYYGYAVAISADGMRALVGAPYAAVTSFNGTQIPDAGKVYVLVYSNSGANGGSWSVIKELDDPNPQSNDHFGQAVALSPDGETALIGAPGATLKGTGGTAVFAGKAYFYSDVSGTWQETQELDDSPAGGPLPNDQFGYAVALGGSSSSALVALIGAPGASVACPTTAPPPTTSTSPPPPCASTAGAVYLFNVMGGTAAPAKPNEFQDPDALVSTTNKADDGYQFGAAVAISADGGTAVFGAPYADVSTTIPPATFTAAGRVYFSVLGGTTWGTLTETDETDLPSGAASNDHFGAALALSGNGTLCLVGAPGVAAGAGIAYLYNSSAVLSVTELGGPVAGDQFGAALAFSGDGNLAIIGAPGASVSDTVTTGSGSSQTSSTYKSLGAGKAYVYSVGSWNTPAYTLADPDALNATADDAAKDFNFGSAVALSAVNGTALVGAPKSTVSSYVVAGTADFYFNPVDLSLRLSASAGPAPLSGQFSYLFTVTSKNPLIVNGASQPQATNATHVILTDTLPAGVTFSSADGAGGSCANNGGIVTCTLSGLGPGDDWQPSITVATAATPSQVANQNVVVGADQLETDDSDNSAGVSTIVDDAPTAVSNAAASAIPVHVVYSGTLPVNRAYTNQPLTYNLMSNPAHGSVVLDAGSGAYTYTAKAGYGNAAGGQPDSFTFEAKDDYLSSKTVRVYLQVYAAPTAASAAITAHVSVTGKLSATEPDPVQTPVFGLVVQPLHGKVTLNSTTGNYTYTGDAGYIGNDRFAFNVRDRFNTSNTATVNVTVFAAPQAIAAGYGVAENQVLHAALSGTEPDPTQTLGYTIVQSPAHGKVQLDASTGTFTYTPARDYSGKDSFTFNVSDSFNTSNTATVTVNVAAAPPVPPPPKPPSSGGGGGSAGPASLLWLGLTWLGIVLMRRRRMRRMSTLDC